MTKVLGKLTVVLFAAMCGSFVALGEISNDSKLAGDWQSQPVRLVRGDMEEVYVFNIRLAGDERNGVMDIDYFSRQAPDRRRLIRQDIVLETDRANDQTIMAGAKPRLISGPEIIGVYEPDSLYCATADRASDTQLACSWGSPAHGNAPVVNLSRKE